MTSMTQATTIASITIMLTALTMSNAFASHPLPELDTFANGSQGICYQMTALDSVYVNGGTGENDLLKDETEDARAHISSNTDMTLTYDSSCQSNDNQVSAQWMSSSTIASMSVMLGSGSTEHKIFSYNTNSSVNLDTSSICTGGSDPPPEFVANHEFGHFAGLYHAEWYDSESHTMMKSSCGSGYASIKTEDKNQINGIY